MNLPYRFSARGIARSASMLTLVLALSFFVAGCGDDKSTQPEAGDPTGEMTHMTACKKWDSSPGLTARDRDEDCIEYQYEHRTLELKHVNAGFNCCPDIQTTVLVAGDTIFINEREIQGNCHCLCLYDLDYEIRHLEAWQYRVVVTEAYLEEGDQPLEFTIDLVASPSGSYCVARNHYPWKE